MRRLLVFAALFPLTVVGFAETGQGVPSSSREIRKTPSDPGRVTARRLNRNEYNNTIRDLLGVDVRPADDFPQDDSGYGFDNIGDVLSMSPALMEKYVTAAERVARLALFGPAPMKPTVTRLRSDGRRVREARTVPAEYDITGLSLPNAFHAIYRVPVDGEYVVRAVLAGVRPKASEPITVSLWIDQQQVRSVTHDPEASASFGVDRQDFGGQTAEFRVTLTSGDRWLAVAIPRIYEGLPARYGGPNPSKRPSPPPAAKPEDIPLNGARANFVEIAGPYSQASGPSRESVEKIYSCGHGNAGHRRWCAVRVVADLARRAFRRPIGQRELDKFVGLVRLAERHERSAFARRSGSELRRTSPFKEGLAVGIQALLVSPEFLFRIERDTRTAAAHPITARELATRLAYFLWASTPDVELRRAADRGTLSHPHVLASQVRRMLADPKARALAEHFGGQWLQFRALESITRDRDRFPDFEDYLRLSMRRETELFIEDIVREDRSILDFIDGRYSFINERLARHYGIPGVSGPAFRRVDLTGSPRGGVLTHASVLTISSYSTRTSPVLRGKWILENLLNTPPPDPPADVPNLDETAITSAAAMREQLEAHRKNPTCAACHRRMDPLGFGLENFDAVGAWRAVDGNAPVDASGVLPDGRRFTGPEELRAILKADRDAFARCLTSKLLTYALGRGLEPYDAGTVRLIASHLPAYDYKFSGLVLEIVNSLPFRSRRGAPAP
jgi:hypothetical protein